MASLSIAALRADLDFGARVRGVTHAALTNGETRTVLAQLFEDRGLIVFEDVEPSGAMHVAISDVFGPLKDHPVAAVPRVDGDVMPGVIDMEYKRAEGGVVEIGGRQLAQWLPWHFDHCYNNELNRAGVLRAIAIAPEGGTTGFADGIELYRALSPDLREAIEGENILYTLDLAYERMRFGKDPSFRIVEAHEGHARMREAAKALPRAIHPAVWQRADGAKVLHVSPWMSVGIEGREDAEGDALFEAVCQEVVAKVNPYHHAWNPGDMLIWDNWRMLHSVSGSSPDFPRRMQRTTIKGDYGLGRFEHGGTGGKVLEMTV